MNKGRPPKLKVADLKAAGYSYKLEHLTAEEQKERHEGRKGIINGKECVLEPTDYDYFHKTIDGLEIKIFHVNGDFYFQGVKIKKVAQLPLIEQNAAELAHYKALEALVEDTKPVELNNIQLISASLNGDGTYGLSYKNINETINLIGGPLDGQQRTWNTKLPFCMIQYEVEIVNPNAGTNPKTPTILAARYKRDKENHSNYIYDPSIF